MSSDLSNEKLEWLKRFYNKGEIPIIFKIRIYCPKMKRILKNYDTCKKCECFIKIYRCVHTTLPQYIECNYKF